MTDWLSAAAMLLSGLVIGFMILYSLKRSKPAAAAKTVAVPLGNEAEVRDLEAKRDALVRQLRELDDADPDADVERSRLEGEAAAVLRQLDGVRSAPSPKAGAPATPSSAVPHATALPATAVSPAVKGFAWGLLTACVLGGIGWYVVQQSKPREAGQPTTGGTMQPQASAQQTEVILAKVPNDAKALTYQALVRMSMGQSDAAKKMLVSATKSDPTLTDAYVALAWLDTMSGRDTEAGAAIKEAIKHHPEDEARLNDVLGQMRTKAAQRPQQEAQPAAAGMPMQPPSGSAPMMQASAAAVPAADSAPPTHITLTVAPGAKIPPGAVIYVIVRDAGVTAGPPAAVKRLPLGTFPLRFDITAADSMMGQPLPTKMRIEARVDTDGNAMTKDPTDLNAVQDGVVPGASVTLVAK